MPQKLLQLVSLPVLLSAGQRTLRIRMRHFLQKCLDGYAIPSTDVQTFIDTGGVDLLEDCASLRAWMWSVSCLDRSVRAGGVSIPLDAIDHLQVDASYGRRVGELLFWQLLGIIAGQALRAGRGFHFSVSYAPPQCLQLEGVGQLRFSTARKPGNYTIQVEGKMCAIASTQDAFCATIGIGSVTASRDFVFDPAHSITSRTRLAYDDNVLSRQFFQPLPLLAGSTANSQLGDQLRRCWSALTTSGIEGLSEVLALCDSLIGLVSLSDCIGSASREEALGLVFLPAGTDDLNLAECWVHEALHQFLFRIEESADVFALNNSAENFYSPWRTDGRPLRMVLHGAFVFSGIASLHIHWHHQRSENFPGSLETAFRRLEESAMALATVQRHGVLSAVGRKIIAAIEAEIAHARTLLDGAEFLGVRESIQQRQHEFPALVA